jgi:hypothetical protein
LALATQGRFLHPTYYGVTLSAQLIETRRQAAELTAENARLQAVLDYLKTPAGQELAARSDVMALKPGERLVVLSEAAQQAAPETVSAQAGRQLTRFGDEVVSRLRYVGEVCKIWGGLTLSTRPGPASAAPAVPPVPPAPPKAAAPTPPAAPNTPAG